MSTKTAFLLPDFDKNIPDKVNDDVEVKSRHVLSISAVRGWHSAIANSGFSSKTDGVYVFATKIDNIRNGNLGVGFTDVKTYDSTKSGSPGAELTGTSLYCYYGARWPDCVPYLSPAITKTAKEIISILTISFNRGKKEIMWIVDGNEGAVLDCTRDFRNGDEFFPCISLGNSSQQVEFIPFDQVKSRSPLIEKFLKEYSPTTNQSKGAVANNNNNTSAPALAQLQQELEKERKRADLAEAQLQQEKNNFAAQLQLEKQQHDKEKQTSAAKDQQLQQKDQEIQQKDAEIDRLRQLLNPSPFVKDKLYQIDFTANGITPPTNPNAFGTLLKLPSIVSSPLFSEARSMFRTAGSWAHGTAQPVAGFELKEIEVINAEVTSLETRMRRLQQLRSQNGSFFNPPTGAFTADQLQTLISLGDQFLPRPSNATDKTPNLINVFHGTKVDRLQSVVNGLVAVRSTDEGFFGLGVYTTTSIEYAAKYARGDFDANDGPYPPRASDGCIPVVWCVAAVGVCYPVTPQEDYKKRNDGNSDFFGAGLKPGYDCHCAGVSQANGFQAVPRQFMQYTEVVFDQEAQVLPIAVLWVKEI